VRKLIRVNDNQFSRQFLFTNIFAYTVLAWLTLSRCKHSAHARQEGVLPCSLDDMTGYRVVSFIKPIQTFI
jgi:hypothetical protein